MTCNIYILSLLPSALRHRCGSLKCCSILELRGLRSWLRDDFREIIPQFTSKSLGEQLSLPYKRERRFSDLFTTFSKAECKAFVKTQFQLSLTLLKSECDKVSL